MRRLLWLLGFLSLVLLFPPTSSALPQVVAYRMTKPKPPACAQAAASYPTAYTSFSATETEAYLWFYVTGASTGDVFSTEYYTPANQFYPDVSGAFDPLDSDGNWCFVDLPFEIAGHQPASLPGAWTVRVLVNGSLLFSLQFTITAATTCTYALSPTTATVAAAGGTGSATMTAAAGCSWTAASSVAWITTSSSGSGSGTINYTVAANTATASRSGSVTAGGQTLAITQSAAAGGGSTPTGNLLQNWDAETGTASTDYNGLRTIPGWVADGNATVYRYNGGGGYIDATMPGPPSRGLQFFGGGFAGASRLAQTIDLTASTSAIDGGNQSYTLDGWLGGFDGQDDNVVLRATFKNSSGATLGSGSIGPVLSAERGGNTSLIQKTFTGKVPAGARSAEISLEFTRVSGSANDGYADNLYFGLTSGGSGTSSLNLNINQVIDTSCPSNRVIVSVTDAAGRPVTGLTTANFTLKESGSTRTITVSPVGGGSTSGALSLAILIDTSGSISSTDLANEKAAAKQLVTQVGASDLVAVYRFESTVQLVQDFTSDKTKLNTAIDGIPAGGNTALYQAIQTASQALGARTGRKAIVLMTDGEDSVGGTSIDQAIAAAKTAGVPVFPVGFGSANQTILTRIATETGGFYSTSSTSANLQTILQSIGQVISSQYEIAYTSLNTSSDNPVEITVTYNGQTATASRTVVKCANSGGGSGTCTYFLQPQSVTAPAAGLTGTIIVSTQAGCAVNATSNVSWIHIAGSSSGAVSYQVDANTGAARSGSITIGNRTVTVTQDGGTASCAYSLTPASNTIGALGGSSSVRLTTSAGCAWTAAATGSGWFRLTSPASGAGMANMAYTVSTNNTTQPRSATITAAGLTFTLTQQAGTPAGMPAIADNGIVNAASNRAGTIARGSFFTIYGANLGPSPYQQVSGYPIPDSMGGVVVTVSQGSYNKRAYLHFVSAPQINAILPSDAPLGDVQITVTYNGAVGSVSTATVVNTAFGVFSTASGPGPGIVQNYNSAADQPLNLQSSPLKPNQLAILWGTGLGPIATPDNQPPAGGDLPVPVEVRVGGKLATKLYSGRAPSFAGVDNIYFEVPQDAPMGCSVPVQINAGGVVSNTVRVAISADGRKCQDAVAPFGNTMSAGSRHGTIGLLRVALSGNIDSTKPAVDNTFDVGFASFSDTPAGGELGFSPFFNLHPVGTCSSTNKLLDAGGVIASSGLTFDKTNSKQLDAGTELTVTGPNGSRKLSHFDPNVGSGPYVNAIGGSLPVGGAAVLPLFLDAGSYTVTGTGGADVGAFSAPLTIPSPLTWTNATLVTSINRSAGVTLTWTGGDPAQTVVIGGGSTDQKSKKSGGFICLAPASAGTFTVPPSALTDLPPTGNVIGTSDSLGTLFLGAAPLANPATFTAPGLAAGRIFYTFLTARAVPVQ